MDVEDHLTCSRTRIERQIVVGSKALDSPAELVEGPNERHLILEGKVGETGPVPLGHDEEMAPGEWKDVEKRKGRGIFVDNVRGGPPSDDVAKDATHGVAGRRGRHRTRRPRGELKGYRTRPRVVLIRGGYLSSTRCAGRPY